MNTLYISRWSRCMQFVVISVIWRWKYSQLGIRTRDRRGFRGDGGSGVGVGEFSKYTSQRTTFSALAWGIFTCTFKNFRLASLAYYHIYLCKFPHYRSTILQIALEISRSCIVRILSTFVIEQQANFSESVKVQMLLTKNLQNTQFSSFL